MLSSYRLGTIYYYREDYPAASKEFEYFLSRFPTADLAFDVTYNLAATDYQLGNYDKASQVLSRLQDGGHPGTRPASGRSRLSARGTSRGRAGKSCWSRRSLRGGNSASDGGKRREQIYKYRLASCAHQHHAQSSNVCSRSQRAHHARKNNPENECARDGRGPFGWFRRPRKASQGALFRLGEISPNVLTSAWSYR